MISIILNTDSYKASHYLQYPPGTAYLSAYLEARGGDFTETVFFGLQAFILEYLCQPITQDHILEAKTFFLEHGLPFNEAGWLYILKTYNGYLPLKIEAVPEGLILPTGQVMLQIVNTDPACYWLTTYVETALLRAIWYPSTVATVSYACKKVIAEYLQQTAGHLDGLDFKLHDFGARGASCLEAAHLGGMAHLIHFKGSDTIAGVLAAKKYYQAPMAAYSIPAAEHSVIVSYGKENEVDAYRHILNAFKDVYRYVAIVSDSYDLWHAIEFIWAKQLKTNIIEHGGTLVIRPDSGDPVAVVTGVIDMLMHHFGYSINELGYKVLPPYLRVIQGDGICLQTIEEIVREMQKRKQSIENITFGMGAALLQKVNRDTLRFAMKASAIHKNGQWLDIAKSPKTDLQKTSKAGRLALIKNNQNQFETIKLEDLGHQTNYLKPVFENGQLLYKLSFEDIRAHARRTNT